MLLVFRSMGTSAVLSVVIGVVLVVVLGVVRNKVDKLFTFWLEQTKIFHSQSNMVSSH